MLSGGSWTVSLERSFRFVYLTWIVIVSLFNQQYKWKKSQLCRCCCFFLSFRTSHVSHHRRLLKTYIYGSGVQACVCVPVCVNINMNRLTKRYESFSCAHNPWIILHIILCSRIKLWNTSILCQEYGSKATLKKLHNPFAVCWKWGKKHFFWFVRTIRTRPSTVIQNLIRMRNMHFFVHCTNKPPNSTHTNTEQNH